MPGEPKQAGEVIAGAFGPGDHTDDDDEGDAPKAKPKRPVVVADEPLGHVAGKAVLAMGLKMTKAGDGLSTAMTVAAIQHDIDDEFYVLCKVQYRKAEYEKLPKEIDGLRLVEVTDVVASTIVDDKWAEKAIVAQQKINAKAEEQAVGVQRLPGVEE